MENRLLQIENNAKSLEVVMNDKDFEDLLDKHLGYEAAEYYRLRIEELKGRNNDKQENR